MTVKVYIKNFGCKVNQAEGEYLRNLARSTKLELGDENDAKLVIVNSCAVTSRTEQKIYQYIRSIRRRNPRAKIAVVGCLGSLLKNLKTKREGLDIDYIAGHKEKFFFLNTVGTPSIEPDLWASSERFYEHTRAFVKIQDGCEHFCSYCIVPFLRGKEISRPLESILAQVERLSEKGFMEIVLVGVRVGSWQSEIDNKKLSLVDLLRILTARFPQIRIRITSLEPWEINRELINFISTSSTIAKHFHIPLQSGSDRLLKLMNRPYSAEEFESLVLEIKRLMPTAGIGLDIIVGFPGETEADFLKTVELVKRLPISYIHPFRFSARPWTVASKLQAQVSGEEKMRRLRLIKNISINKRQEFLRSFVSQTLEVIPERVKNGVWSAHSDNYILCQFRSCKKIRGKLVRVKGIEPQGNALFCELVE